MQLIDCFNQNKQLETFIENLKPQSQQMLTGLTGSAKTLFLAHLLRKTAQPLLVVEPDSYHASQLADDLSQLLPDEQVQVFLLESSIATQIAVSSPESLSQRLKTLDFLQAQKTGIVVTSIAGLEYVLPTPADFAENHLKLQVGDNFDLTKLPEKLLTMGYHRDSLVSSPGEYAIRGDIFDIFPLTEEKPWRIEFFGDEVDTIHSFNPETQRSQTQYQQVLLSPASDQIVDSNRLQEVGRQLKKVLARHVQKVKDQQIIKTLQTNYQSDIEALLAGERVDNLGEYIDFLYTQPAKITDYLVSQSLVIFDDYERIQEQDRTNNEENTAWFSGQFETGKLLPDLKFRWTFKQAVTTISQGEIFLSLFPRSRGHLRLEQLLNVTSRSIQQFFSNLPLLKAEIERWQKQAATVILLISSSARLQKMQQTLTDFGITADVSAINNIKPAQTQLVVGGLHTGFELADERIVVITEKELFNKQPKRRRSRTTMSNAERLKSYTDLKPGDYVVHVNHGIGKFLGIQTLEVDGKHQDYITIEYRDQGQLFIPVTQLDMVQKYVSAQGKAPKLNKLGGTEWHKTKQRVQKNIEDIADDLIDLYAQREAEKGYAFSADDDLQKQFDAQFPYVETPDQLRSIAEVKRDMESPHPMDRLLVGDVGFGKTEVALRAAFKAINDGKQVAFLVPTTILAQQHYQTMQERFADFPIKTAILTRFQTPSQQSEIKAGLADGTIDMVVGTHRILSKDVQFLDLGFLIIDEEQRFGVKHKERLKQMKSQIDVLTLTATPIPRTLNMSMMGVRDLSVIETAPPNRYPIQTFVMEQNYDVIRSAIERELNRNGQVFYLHNRVEDIEQTASLLATLVPDAHVAIAHGKMTQAQLEGVMSDFLNGDYDVLVTTTIIETGVDISNTNTLIVENADRYGLSQLYQLRGRVGRSSRVAYAYFMYQKDKTLSEVGEKRLEAVKNFTELGSGFKIAMRDLAIRGAGNLLGKQQHGFIDSVGYDLYTQMLAEAVAKKQGKNRQHPRTDAQIQLDLEAYIPTSYISDERQKIEMYKRLRQAKSEAELTDLKQEFKDRFGKYPSEVANLLKATHLKLLADQALITKIKQQSQQIMITFGVEADKYLNGEKIFQDLALSSMKAQVNFEHEYFTVSLNTEHHSDYLKQLQTLLQRWAQAAQPVAK